MVSLIEGEEDGDSVNEELSLAVFEREKVAVRLADVESLRDSDWESLGDSEIVSEGLEDGEDVQEPLFDKDELELVVEVTVGVSLGEAEVVTLSVEEEVAKGEELMLLDMEDVREPLSDGVFDDDGE